MSNAPPTPSDEPTPPQTDIPPPIIPYSESFENALMELILNPPNAPHPPTPQRDQQQPEQEDMAPSSLPLPLDSPLRTHPSPIPGLYLTHPNGTHMGGPGASAEEIRKFAERMEVEEGVGAGDKEGLRRVMEGKMREVRERMAEREKAVRRNREVEEELDMLRLQRDAELRVLEKMKGRK